MTLSALQIEQFNRDGFVKVEGAFARETAAACREILWRDLGLSPDRPEEWTQPVVRLGLYGDPPFCEALNSPRLHGALDQLAGEGRAGYLARVVGSERRAEQRHEQHETQQHRAERAEEDGAAREVS